MNYLDRFGRTEPDADFDAALVRAFALGIASRSGEAPAEELDRIRAIATSRYERQLLETAYHEGRQFDIESTTVDRALATFASETSLDIDKDLIVVDVDESLRGVPPALTDTPIGQSVPPTFRALSLPPMLFGRDHHPE